MNATHIMKITNYITS